jgi:glucosamine-6-phosphate deaminase
VTLVEERKVGQLDVRVHDDPLALARAAAEDAAGIIGEAVAQRGVANVMFATGNSQIEFVNALVGGALLIPWGDVVVFHMDEYVGVGADHPASFQRWIRERISEKVRPRYANYLDGVADPSRECSRYAGLLGDHPIDLCCLGIGENGHLAFNDPPVADFDDPLDVKVVDLDEDCRRQQVGEGHFPDIESVPRTAMTVTIPALLRAGKVLGVVPEVRKAKAVLGALVGPITTSCPASVLRSYDNTLLHLDRGSSSMLGWSTKN